MKDKIILATVNCKKKLYASTADEFAAIAPNVPMGLLASYIKSKNIDVEIIDSETDGISIDSLISIIEKKEPILLGIICSGANPSSSTMTIIGVIDFFEKFNQLKISGEVKTFIWGSHPTVLPERTLMETNADFLIRGEGYESIVELYHSLKGDYNIEKVHGISYLADNRKYVHNEDAILIKNLDTLPMIDWEIMNPYKYRAHNWHCFGGDINNRVPYAIVWTSFGCPYLCNFCCINNLFGRRTHRFRSISSVINEISILVEKYNVKHIKILDELFVIKHPRIEEFCDRLEQKGYDLNMWSFARLDTVNRRILRRLKKVGMNWIAYGIESVDSKIITDVKKRCKANLDDVIKMTQDEGIYICADIIFGLWEDDLDSMTRTYDFLIKYNFEWINIYPGFAYPGTELYDQLIKDKVINIPEKWDIYSLYGYDCIPLPTKYLSPRDVLKFRDESFNKYLGRSEYLSMVENKFGIDTKEHIIKMINTPLRRKLLENQ